MMKRWLGVGLLALCLWTGSVAAAAEPEAEPGDGIRSILAQWREQQAAQTTAREQRSAAQTETGRIRLLWQMDFSKQANLEEPPTAAGVNVISPCWFVITGEKGTIEAYGAKADRRYSDAAHAKGYKIWALVSNHGFDPEVTGRFLGNAGSQKAAIQNILKLAETYRLDGINLDFENINLEDRDRLTAFATAAAKAFRRKGLVVSMDVTPPSDSPNWSLCYDRRALAEAMDYLALMAYDEHSAGASEAGPVASLPWVERSLEATLEEVPAEKLLLGMPLYMRLWEEKDGRLQSVKTLYMGKAEQLLKEKKPARHWQPDLGLHYFEYREGGSLYRVWQEDRRSLALKAALVNRYDLAGAAFWRAGHETADVWPVLDAVLSAAAP